jgi:hypothetical protein
MIYVPKAPRFQRRPSTPLSGNPSPRLKNLSKSFGAVAMPTGVNEVLFIRDCTVRMGQRVWSSTPFSSAWIKKTNGDGILLAAFRPQCSNEHSVLPSRNLATVHLVFAFTNSTENPVKSVSMDPDTLPPMVGSLSTPTGGYFKSMANCPTGTSARFPFDKRCVPTKIAAPPATTVGGSTL